MATVNETASLALFCDFENIALGVRDAQYEKFDIKPILERLLTKGSIVVKKAYCDWDRYKGFKSSMHEANFEMIEIPHVRQSGKNSADIRMVVDALDLCYTKAHVDTFVIISGDSDFSPLVSKLRENAKRVIGVGVKQSCSDLLVTNCDEFIYYDDLVRDRESQRGQMRRERDTNKRSPEEEARRKEKAEERRLKAVDLVAATLTDLLADRGDGERVWASVLKEVVKRRNPGFSEGYFGFRTFGNLLEDAATRGLLTVGRDDKSGTYVMRAQVRGNEDVAEPSAVVVAPESRGEEHAVLAVVVDAQASTRETVPAAESAVVLESVPEGGLPVEAGHSPVPSNTSGRRGPRGRGRAQRSAQPVKDPVEPVLPPSEVATPDQVERSDPPGGRKSAAKGGRKPRTAKKVISNNPDALPDGPSLAQVPDSAAADVTVKEVEPAKPQKRRRSPAKRGAQKDELPASQPAANIGV